MISLIRRIALATALLFGFSIPAVAQTPALDFDRLQDETAQRLSEYLRINTSNPPGNELATARWLKETLAKEGIEGQILDTAELGPGRRGVHGDDERLSLENIEFGLRLYAGVLEEMQGGGERRER